ncbi:hypothetical protein [Marichromatium bheemlicum]|uniref:Zinc resistance-associated protein n=1 Tax=Marichromatium bheemlicum TaxID=365339 RepID=A0ABX1I8U5_9GAMM|nr:hypothetical protein [Marichromatium bheemlicum]NKN32800.1 hypothetical protein [Marichromatium bheemlicum]
MSIPSPRTLALLCALGVVPVQAQEPAQMLADDHHATMHEVELLSLPHTQLPVAILELPPAQRARVQQELLTVYPPQILPRVERALVLERQLRAAVLEDGATVAELASELDELARLEREITELRIEALVRLRALTNAEQFARLVGGEAAGDRR